MSFIADKQTLDDLNLASRYKPDALIALFKPLHTTGGEKLLEYMFNHPMTDPVLINRRSGILHYFQQVEIQFPFERHHFDLLESYIDNGIDSSLLLTGISLMKMQLLGLTVRDERYAQLHSGVLNTIMILNGCRTLFEHFDAVPSNPYYEQVQLVKGILQHKDLEWLEEEKGTEHLSFFKFLRYDYVFRHTLRQELKIMMEALYHLDIYITVARVATQRNFTYAHALPKEGNILRAVGMYHPSLKNAVGNSVEMEDDSNLIFLTGANMAGKSTLMKALGCAVYLAHMGFPIAAKSMEFSVKDGIYSSINVPDNINLGYSHFYAEVLRVKRVAEEISSGKSMMVLFDELFKGTNVKDAYDATLAVTEAFAAYNNCFFIISTHIIEVGEALKGRCRNIRFHYLPTAMNGAVPQYTYLLERGITADRQGMVIIENEKILEILRDTPDLNELKNKD